MDLGSRARRCRAASCYGIALGFLTLVSASRSALAFSFSPATNYPSGAAPNHVAVADLNGDSRPDMVAADYGPSSNTVSVFLGDGLGGFGPRTAYAVGTNPVTVAIADLNGDGKRDLAVCNWSSASVSVLIGDGLGGFGAQTTYFTGGRPISGKFASLNGDAVPDLVVADWSSSAVSVLLGNGTGGFGAATSYATGYRAYWLDIADLNADGKADVAVANYGTNTVSILLGNGSGGFGAHTDFLVGNNPISIAVGDLDEDGKLDLATANQTDNTSSVLLGDGAGGFGVKTDFAVGAGPLAIGLADFDRDGHLDIAIANYTANTVSLLQGNGLGSFGSPVAFATAAGPTRFAIHDLDVDNKPDLVVPASGANTISVLHNSATAILVPDPDHSICPFEATVGSDGKCCFDVLVKSTSGDPVAASTVMADFSGCDITFCPEQPPGVTVNPATKAVLAIADDFGLAHFCICATFAAACSITVYADGVPICRVAVSDCDPCPVDTCCSQKPQWTNFGFSGFTGPIAIQTSEPLDDDDPVVTVYNLDSPVPPLNTDWTAMQRYKGPLDGSGKSWWRGLILGAVFGLTIDDQGFVYVCQASCYMSDPVAHLPGAQPGGIYRIHPVAGIPTTFKVLPNAPDPIFGNEYPELGNISFDCNHRQFFVSNLEDGEIYRLDMNGNILSRFDYVSSFDNGPLDASAGWAPLGDLVWGVQWHGDRVYYSVWSCNSSDAGAGPNSIRSVALDASGDFILASDKQEFTLPFYQGQNWSNPIADISFMSNGEMLLAERSMTTVGWPDAHHSRLLRYRCRPNGTWVPSGLNYVLGEFDGTNCAGGVDHDFSSYAGGPHGRVWVSSDAIHFGNPDVIYGVIGLPPNGSSTTQSYLVDHNGISDVPKTSLGDVEVPCPATLSGAIQGMKFNDLDCDGTKDPGEPGLPGWTIHVSGPTTLTTTTDGSGNYFFENLPLGTYSVCELGTFGWRPTLPASGCYSVNLTTAGALGLDFGNCRECTQESPCTPPPRRLAAWLPFDEPGGTIFHDIRRKVTGTKVNTPTICMRGSNRALGLNGTNEYAELPDAPALDFGSGTSFTLDAWVSNATTGGTHTVLDKRSPTAVGYALSVVNGRVTFNMRTDTGGTVTYTSGNTIPNNVWRQVVVVVDRVANQGRVYVNTVLDGNFTPPAGSLANSAPLTIGRSSTGTSYFPGCIDEVEIYCRALTVTEITALFAHDKCKQFCSVPSVSSFKKDATQITVNLTICNNDWSQPSTTFSWSCVGLPASGSCPNNGPTGISPNHGSVPIAAGDCANIAVTFQKPAWLEPGQKGCYEFLVKNMTTLECFGCQGSVRAYKRVWFDLGSDIGHLGDPVSIRLNSDLAGVDSVTMQVEDVAGALSSVEIDGLPAGVALTLNLEIPAGGFADRSFYLRRANCGSVFIDHIVVKLDEDRTGNFEDVAVFRVVGDSVTLVDVAPTGDAPRPMALTLAPNPSHGPVTLRLSLPQGALVDVDVFDLLGRRVRRLHHGVRPAGDSRLVWDSTDDSGRPVRSGLYFVRLISGGVRMDARLVRIE